MANEVRLPTGTSKKSAIGFDVSFINTPLGLLRIFETVRKKRMRYWKAIHVRLHILICVNMHDIASYMIHFSVFEFGGLDFCLHNGSGPL